MGFFRLAAPSDIHPGFRPAPSAPVVVVFPARNEQRTVSGLVARTPPAIDGRSVEVIVVDDWSADGTATAARAAGATVTRPHAHRGLGAAVRHGIGIALTRGPAAVVFLDADGEYRPEEIPALVRPILDGTTHYVVGSRFTGRIESMAPQRRLGNTLLTRWLAWTVRRRVTDGQSGFRALSADAAADAVMANDYNYAQTLTIELLGLGYGYHEVPITYRRRAHGRGFVRLGTYLRSVIPAARRELARIERAGAELNRVQPARESRPPRLRPAPLLPARPGG